MKKIIRAILWALILGLTGLFLSGSPNAILLGLLIFYLDMEKKQEGGL